MKWSTVILPAFLSLGMQGVAAAACRGTDFAVAGARGATVRGGTPRTDFLRDGDEAAGCPGAAASCRSGAYVVAGDAVLLAPGEADGYVCAAFARAGTETTGWLPAAAVVPDAAAPGDWAGRWVAEESRIRITTAVGGLKVSGEATWGTGDPDRVRRGGVHIGEVEGTAMPHDGVLAFTVGDDGTLPYEAGDETSCRIRMLRRGPYLVVHDNMGCGGANVSFTGLYRRRN